MRANAQDRPSREPTCHDSPEPGDNPDAGDLEIRLPEPDNRLDDAVARSFLGKEQLPQCGVHRGLKRRSPEVNRHSIWHTVYHCNEGSETLR